MASLLYKSWFFVYFGKYLSQPPSLPPLLPVTSCVPRGDGARCLSPGSGTACGWRRKSASSWPFIPGAVPPVPRPCALEPCRGWKELRGIRSHVCSHTAPTVPALFGLLSAVPCLCFTCPGPAPGSGRSSENPLHSPLGCPAWHDQGKVPGAAHQGG